MGFRTLLSARSSRRARKNVTDDSENINSNSNFVRDNKKAGQRNLAAVPAMGHNRKQSALVTGFQKVFQARRRDNSAVPTSAPVNELTPASSVPVVSAALAFKNSNGFQSRTQTTEPAPSPPSAAGATVIEYNFAPPSSTPPTGLLTPPSTAEHASAPSPSTKSDTQADELEATMAAMCAAEKLLNRRHAAIKPQANTCKKIKPREMVTKKTGPQGGIIKARLPVNIAPPENRRMQSRTANEACEALQRRRAIKNMAFYAADGCPTNVDIIEQINAHFYLKERHPKIEVSDVTFKIENMNIRASQLPQGSVERNWISRYNVMIHNVELIERRLLNIEDHEVILMQLFPMERDHILKLKHFEIFVAGLGEEGIFTKSQANTIAKLGVTTEEYDKGAQFTGLSVHPHAHRRNPTSIATFDIPKQPSRANASFSPHPLQSPDRDPHYYLRTLVEAAAYKQNFWKGYFFPNACSQLDSYFQAHKLSQEGFLLCPTLTDYKRDWTHRESRTLQRGQLICELLFKYDNNSLTDYGIIRAVRATYVQIPGQPFFNAEDLESFLYHRIPESGLDIFNIPDILTLHPENDTAFSTARLRQHVIDGLLDRAELFEAEEQQRCLDIEHSFAEFEIARKKDMSAWQRVKASVKTMFGRMEIVAPFDPFAPEHCEEEEEEEKGKEVAPELVG